MAYCIPEIIPLPWGYVAWVKEVAPDDPELEGAHATWDVESRTIYLDRSKPLAEKRGSLMHEGDHAWNDWKLWCSQSMNVKMPEAHEAPEELDETE